MISIRNCLMIVLLMAAGPAGAQEKIIVHGSTPSLYLVHMVERGETWYSMGRMFNVNPRELVEYNSTSMEKTLRAGQTVRIPLEGNNFSQDGIREADEVFVPLYHFVKDREWMYRISVNHNKVPIEALEKWNGITNNQLRPGMALVVGYLKVRPGQSPLARLGVRKVAEIPAVADVAKASPPASPFAAPEKKPEGQSGSAEDTEKETAGSQDPGQGTVVQARMPANSSARVSSHRGGFFKSIYRGRGNSSNGNAGIFRSTSGWNDGKYYALMNNVPVGTIIRVTFPSTQKSVYAKVLGQLPEMKESIGLIIRLSDAAASELGVSMNKFYVDIAY